jgi:hypothetical protein
MNAIMDALAEAIHHALLHLFVELPAEVRAVLLAVLALCLAVAIGAAQRQRFRFVPFLLTLILLGAWDLGATFLIRSPVLYGVDKLLMLFCAGAFASLFRAPFVNVALAVALFHVVALMMNLPTVGRIQGGLSVVIPDLLILYVVYIFIAWCGWKLGGHFRKPPTPLSGAAGAVRGDTDSVE